MKKGNLSVDKLFTPEKYGMTLCVECNGSGKLPEAPEGISVCQKCGGFGYIKKEEETADFIPGAGKRPKRR